MKITIPKTIKEATKSLNDLDGLLTAKGWERAAIVAAFVGLAPGRGKPIDTSNRQLPIYSCEDFAALGIKGLLDNKAVNRYVQAWLDVNEGVYPTPGQAVTLPTSEFPPTRTGTDGYDSLAGAQRTIERIVAKHGPAPVQSVVKADPVVRAASAQAMAGSAEAIDLTKQTMSDPKNAAFVIKNKAVEKSITQAQIDNMRGNKPVRPVPVPPTSGCNSTVTALTWGILSDDLRRLLANLMGMIPDASDELADMISEFLTDEVLPSVQGCLELLDVRGHEMTVGDFE